MLQSFMHPDTIISMWCRAIHADRAEELGGSRLPQEDLIA